MKNKWCITYLSTGTNNLGWQKILRNFIGLVSKACLLLEIYKAREATLIIQIPYSYIRSKVKYLCYYRIHRRNKLFGNLEKIQKNFTSEIRGLGVMDSNKQLKKLGIYSMATNTET